MESKQGSSASGGEGSITTGRWREVASYRDSPVFSELNGLRGYPSMIPEGFLSGHQGRGFVYSAEISGNGMKGGTRDHIGAVLSLDFLFVFSLDGVHDPGDDRAESELGAAVQILLEQLLESGDFGAIHLLPPYCGGRVLFPGSTPFCRKVFTDTFEFREYVRMEFIGNSSDHRSEELSNGGFPRVPLDVELEDGTSVSIRAFSGEDIPREGETHAVDLEEVLANKWSEDLILPYGGAERYRRDGLGVYLYEDGELVCGASSFARYPEAIEVEVDTRPDHRRAGLARWAGAALSVLAAAHDLYLCWDAAHPSSARIAMDLGLGFAGHYICTVFRFSDENRRAGGRN